MKIKKIQKTIDNMRVCADEMRTSGEDEMAKDVLCVSDLLEDWLQEKKELFFDEESCFANNKRYYNE